MKLFSVVRKNVKHNFQNYFLYIASMTFSIVIYFTFVSLQYNKQIGEAVNVIGKVDSAFFATSFILLLFVTMFIWYSNAFFIKKRKQEIGLYSLLGVKKRQIGRMLFYENFLLGFIGLAIGIVVGELFSIFFSMILVKLMGFSFIVHFSLNSKAVMQTLLVFIILIFLTSLQGYFIMYRFQLIDLFQARTKGENAIKPSIIVALASIVFIGVSYWMLLGAAESKSWDQHFTRNLMVTFSFMILGSYGLFHSLSGYFVKTLQKRKSIFYKWKNLLTFSQLSSRLKSNALMLTTIAILNGVTLIAFGFAYTIYYNTLHSIEKFSPYSYQYEVTSLEVDNKITKMIQKNKDNPLQFEQTFHYLMVKGDASSLKTIPGGYHYYEEKFAVMSEKTYNQLVEKLDRKGLQPLKENDAVLLGINFIGAQKVNENVNRSVHLQLPLEEINFRIVDGRAESILNNDIQPLMLIVSDQSYERLKKAYEPISTHIFKVKNEVQSTSLTKKIKNQFTERTHLYSFSDSYNEAQSVYGLLIFIGGFLGLVFLSATGSIIYFKMLTEVADDQKRYATLRKVGVSRIKVRQIISRQYMVIFLLPLIVGIAHSMITLGALSKLMDMNFTTPIIISTIVYSLLYGCYYLLTLVTANKLVNP